MRPPDGTDQRLDWLALTDAALPAGTVADWVVVPSCGAVALFAGTARDHAGDRDDVEELVYEAYEEQVVPKLAEIADEMRVRWPDIGRIALLHRVGRLAIGETAVVVAVSTPHRPEAFAAARYGIDAVKASVPIWKKERWDGGEAWGLEGNELRSPSEVSP
jgi:molybdopterin synthase catalytic subunit